MISASQINTAISCLRRWGLEKIDRHQVAPHRTAVVGTRTHERLEAWLKNGTPPNLDEKLTIERVEYHPGRTAMNGLHNLPPPGPHIAVESAFEFSYWTGRIDFAWVAINGIYIPREQWLAMKDSVDVVPGAGDHKTSGAKGFAYALNEKTLPDDPQSVLYGAALHQEFPRAKEADRLWVYYGTRAPHPSKKVHLRISKDETLYRLEPMNRLAEQLLRLRSSGLKGNDLPPNAAACNKYGGCPHRGGHCKLSNAETMRSYMENGQSLGLDQLINNATQQASAAMTTSAQVPAIPGLPAIPAIWKVHPYNSAYEYNEATQQVREIKAAPAIQMPPATTTYAPVPTPQIVGYVAPGPGTAVTPFQVTSLPPIVMAPQTAVGGIPPVSAPPINGIPVIPGVTQGPNGPIGPDGQPFGSINAPEGQGVAPRNQPVVPAVDPLDAMNKDQLVQLAATMGIDTKRMREAGLRDKIRSAQKAGVQPGAAPIVSAPIVQTQPSPVIGTMPSGAAVTMSEAPLFERTTEERVVDILCAVIQHSGANFDQDAVVAWAKSLVAKIEQ